MNEFQLSAYDGVTLIAQTGWLLEQSSTSAPNALEVFQFQLYPAGLSYSYSIVRRGFSGFSGIPSSALGNSGYSGYSGDSGAGVSGFSGFSGVDATSTSGYSGYSGVDGVLGGSG